MTAIAVNMGDGRERKVALSHTQFPNGGGWSFFICPQCGMRTRKLRLTEDGRLVCRRCDGLLYRCQQHDKETRIAHLRALLYGSPARLKRGGQKPRRVPMDRRRALESALRRLLIRQRQERLERIKSLRRAMT